MSRWNHAYTIAFEVISEREDGKDVTPEMYRAGLLKRIAELDADNEWDQVHVERPFDSYEMEEQASDR